MKNIIDKVKFFFGKDKEFRTELFRIIGFYPHNLELYRIAFAHKSQEYKSKRTGNKPLNNERLEFLGDAVLETIVSDIVYRHFSNKREGFLTNTRSKIVSRESLGKLAKDLGIDRLIQSQTRSHSHNSYLAGNSLEALMGAIYLDRGFRYAFRFVEKRIIGALLDLEGVAQKEVNFKSKLLEWTQKNKVRIDFQDKTSGNQRSNTPSFFTSIVIEGLYIGEGKGYSKKESHQDAAKDALTQISKDRQVVAAVFRAKEKRTAMEADEFFVLPKIEELETETTKAPQTKKERSRKEKSDKKEPRNNNRHNTPQREKSNDESIEKPVVNKTTEKKVATPKTTKKELKEKEEPKEKSEKRGESTRQRKRSEHSTPDNNKPQDTCLISDAVVPAEKEKTATMVEARVQTAIDNPISEKTTPEETPKHQSIKDSTDAIPEVSTIEQPTITSHEETKHDEETISTTTEESRSSLKRGRRRGSKRTNAQTFTNTAPLLAEESHRSEKAVRKAQEQRLQHAIDNARKVLGQELPESMELQSSVSENTQSTSQNDTSQFEVNKKQPDI